MSQPSIPATMTITTLPDPGLRLREPLTVNVCREGDEIVVSHTGLLLHVFGVDLPDALVQFAAMVVEEYRRLEKFAAADRLGPRMLRTWAECQRLIAPVPDDGGEG